MLDNQAECVFVYVNLLFDITVPILITKFTNV